MYKVEKGGVLDRYFHWLCRKVGENESYEALMWYLYENEFVWILEMDRNRASDGLELRDIFKNETGVRGDPFGSMPCSVLEMLVGLSLRIENEVLGDPNICLFWKMMENLGILDCEERDWDWILERWLERKFDPDGYGSIFYIQDPYEDQRDLEIWDQCMSWINEKYGYYN